MLSLKSITKGHDRLMVHPFDGIPTSADRICLYFHYASRFSTLRLAYMLDSLVRVSRRVGWVHLNSGSRDLFSNWVISNGCRVTRTSKKCQQYKHQTSFTTRCGWSRDPFFLRQTSIFTLWSVIHRSEVTKTQLYPAHLTHPEAPVSIVHPSSLQNPLRPFWHWLI